jgi:hypothetical protein
MQISRLNFLQSTVRVIEERTVLATELVQTPDCHAEHVSANACMQGSKCYFFVHAALKWGVRLGTPLFLNVRPCLNLA